MVIGGGRWPPESDRTNAALYGGPGATRESIHTTREREGSDLSRDQMHAESKMCNTARAVRPGEV
jgi:hypothetical protein